MSETNKTPLMLVKQLLQEGLLNLHYIPDSDRSGHPHGYSVLYITDWRARQLLEEIDVSQAEGERAAKDEAENLSFLGDLEAILDPQAHRSGSIGCTLIAKAKEWVERAEKAERERDEWREYWNCDSPHDSHLQMGTLNSFVRQLGKEQERANLLNSQLATSEARCAELGKELQGKTVVSAAFEACQKELIFVRGCYAELSLSVRKLSETHHRIASEHDTANDPAE